MAGRSGKESFWAGRIPDSVLGEVGILQYTDPLDPRKSLEVRVAPQGSNIFFLAVGGRNIVSGSRQSVLVPGAFDGIFNLGPFWAGRETGASGYFNGQFLDARNVPKPDGVEDPALVHGVARLHKWKFGQIIRGDSQAVLTTGVTYNNRRDRENRGLPFTSEAYPYNVRQTQKHILTVGGLTVQTTFENLGDTAAPIGHALHANLSTKISGPDKTEILVPAASHLPLTKAFLPKEPAGLQSVTGTKYDLNRPTSVSGVDLDDYLAGFDPRINAAIYDPVTAGFRVFITASVQYRYCVVFTGMKNDYVAIERQTNSPSPLALLNSGKNLAELANVITLLPGAAVQMWTRFEIAHQANFPRT